MDWQDRTYCTRCSAADLVLLGCAVDDEHHMIFECTHFDQSRSSSEQLAVWLQHTQGDVRAFMLGDNDMVMHFIAACMGELERMNLD